jgi:hypothetical protein
MKTKVHRKDYGWSVGLVYNPTRLSGVTTNMSEVAGVLQNGIRVDTHGFTGTYESVEKDTVTYGPGTWVRTHNAWVLWERFGMVRMLLTGRTIRVCQYWTYGSDQERTFTLWYICC